MSQNEDLLRDLTFKGKTETLEQRIYDSLTMDSENEQVNKDLWLHRVTKAVTCLVLELRAKDVIDDKTIDDWLLEVVR